MPVDRYGTKKVGMLGLILLATPVACLMLVPDLLAGAAYAAGFVTCPWFSDQRLVERLASERSQRIKKSKFTEE